MRQGWKSHSSVACRAPWSFLFMASHIVGATGGVAIPHRRRQYVPVSRIELSIASMSVRPHRAIVVSSSLWMT